MPEIIRVPMSVRASGPDEVVVRASNDRQADAYHTRITAEALTEWVGAFLQHRAVNLEHDQRTLAGYAVEADLVPDLVVRVRLATPEARAAVASGAITGASLEFVPLEWYEQDGEVIYTRLAAEPELTGLGLVSRPAVPGARILETRAAPPLWAYAVVDPIIWQRALPPEEAQRYLYFPHHRADRTVDPAALERAYQAIRAGDVHIPDGATLSRDEVLARAWEHLERHRVYGVLMRVQTRGVVPDDPPRYGKDEESDWEAPNLSDFTDRSWDELDREERIRIARHYAWAPEMPPERFSDLKLPHHDPRTGAVVWRGVVAAMAALLGARGGVDIPAADRERVYAHLARHYREFGREPPEMRRGEMENEEKKLETVDNGVEQRAPAGDTQPQGAPEQGQARTPAGQVLVDPATLEDMLGRMAQRVAQEMAEVISQRAAPSGTTPLGTGPVHVRTAPMSREQAISEVLYRALAPMVTGSPAGRDDQEKITRMLRHYGLSERSISLTGNTAVIAEEVAREVLRRPSAESILRNHYRVQPQAGTLISKLGVWSGAITVTFNRTLPNPIPESTGTHTRAELRVYPYEAAVELENEFERFNILGPSWVNEVFIPEVQAAFTEKEDTVFIQGADPQAGLLSVTGATDVTIAAASNPTAIQVLRAAVRNMPARYRSNPANLAIYARSDIINAALDAIADRQTGLGDATLSGGPESQVQGPRPALYISGVPVYYANALDAAAGNVKAVCVYRPMVRVGQGLAMEIRSFPVANFKTRLEMQEWLGWVFPFPEAIVRVSVA